MKATLTRFRSSLLAVALAAAFLVLSSSSAFAQTASTPDFSASVTSANTLATNMVTTYGPGLVGISLVFLGFMWIWRKIKSAVR